MTLPDQKRILIADNNLQSRTMLGMMLSEEGYKVDYAATGPETVALHQSNPFDLVILELLLKEKDGLQTLVELRQPASPAKFIVLARPGLMPVELTLRMAEKLGAHGVLAEPYRAEALLSLVRKVLNN